MAGMFRALFLASLLLFPGISPAEDSGGGEFWVAGGISVAVIGAAFLGDRPLRDWARSHQDSGTDRILSFAEMAGQWQVAVPVAALYAGGAVFHDGKAKDAAASACVASAIGAGLVTQALKYSAGRARPRQDLGLGHFRPFSGDVSFPSGHTSLAFCVASAVAETYQNPWLSVPLYALAAMTGAARIYHDAHFLSDVTAGAVIGTLSGVYSARFIRKREQKDGISIAPFMRDGAFGGMVALAF